MEIARWKEPILSDESPMSVINDARWDVPIKSYTEHVVDLAEVGHTDFGIFRTEYALLRKFVDGVLTDEKKFRTWDEAKQFIKRAGY